MTETLFSFPLFSKTIHVNWLTLFGLLGNALFTGRVLVQWIASERAGRSVVPVAFWWLSIAASAILIVYAAARHNAAGLHDPDLPMILGLSVTIVPYIRAIRIHHHPDRPARGGTQILLPAAALLLIVVYGASTGLPHVHWPLFFLGLIGNAVYCSRFILAWIRAESTRSTDLPLSFWYTSMAGSFLLLAYSFLRVDLVFILSFLFNAIPYLRNIVLILKNPKAS